MASRIWHAGGHSGYSGAAYGAPYGGIGSGCGVYRAACGAQNQK